MVREKSECLKKTKQKTTVGAASSSKWPCWKIKPAMPRNLSVWLELTINNTCVCFASLYNLVLKREINSQRQGLSWPL